MKEKLIKLFWIFVIGSIIGFFLESIVCVIKFGVLESRKGLVFGPFTPIYGAGALCYAILSLKVKNPKNMFFICFLAGGIVEYAFSWLQEIIFGTISWNYSAKILNIGGRTSIPHMIIWGLLGVLFLKYIYPSMSELIDKLNKKLLYIVTIVMLIFMSFNITISTLAAIRQKERTQKLPPSNYVEKQMDKYFPDEKMDKIYANKRIVKK